MKRVAAVTVVVLLLGTFVVLATGAGGGEPGGHEYWVEMDNAFGLVTGGDLKIAGVRAGKIKDIKLDRLTYRALVGFTITQTGFGSLRTDVTCQSRPQSLIGEYYLNCDPGTSPHLLTNNSINNPIPVTQTDSTIAPDLVQDVLREPYRQRLSIILGELGAGVGGNGANLNAAIVRAVPALQETDSVLGILANQNKILSDLTVQADTVLLNLSNNRKDVQRFIVSAGGAARDSAAEQKSISAGFAELPHFLQALTPAMKELGEVAVNTTPALRNLNASSGELKELFDNIGPFATASTPSFAALGKASVTGDQAAKAATPTIAQLNDFASGTPELSQNLSIILQHLDNPAYGADHDPRAVAQHPQTHSDTYTGLEALLQYVYDQAQDTNAFDGNSHLLDTGIFYDPNCSPYADSAAAKANPTCRSWLGPTQPGVTTPDPTKLVPTANSSTPAATQRSNPNTSSSTPSTSGGSGSGSGSGGSKPPVTLPSTGGGQTCIVAICVPTPATPAPPVNLPSAVQQAGNAVGKAVSGSQQQPQTGTTGSSNSSSSSSQQALLNYLLGP